jgi:hypothetical protein
MVSHGHCRVFCDIKIQDASCPSQTECFLYIARTTIKERHRFSIRESYLKGGVYHCRELMDLGGAPRVYVRYL